MKKRNVFIGIVGMAGIGVLGYLLHLEKKESKSMNQKYDKFKKYYQVYNKWISNNQKGVTNEEILKNMGISSIAVYGNGEIGNRLVESLRGTSVHIASIIEKKAGDIDIDDEYGIPVISVEQLSADIGVDAVVVTPMFDYEKIKEDILNIVPDMQVLSIEDLVFAQ